VAECKYRTDNNGRLCVYNAHPKKVEWLYEVRALYTELMGPLDGLGEIIEQIEFELFDSYGLDFSKWVRHNRLRKEIRELDDLKIFPWDKKDTINLKKRIKRLLLKILR